MASSRFRMISVVLFVVALSALEAYQWDGGPEDKAKITACLGGSASFPWSIVTERDGETILNLDWWFQAPDKGKTQIATYQGKHFYATDKKHVAFVPNAGLSLRYARPHDSGDYSVQVEIQRANLSLTSVSRTVTVSIVYPANCVEWLNFDQQSGIRTVYFSKGKPITVYCDQTTDNGGWIVFQRRQDASVDFYRNWTEYRNGFGDLEGNFWLGLDALHSLTTSRRYQLRVDLKKWNETRGYATYSGFYVEDNDNNFRLHFDNFTGGNANDSLSLQRGQQFTTKDRDNDKDGTNCAQRFHGAWWYNACHDSNLNGIYRNSCSPYHYNGMIWYYFGYDCSMKFSEMKIRPI